MKKKELQASYAKLVEEYTQLLDKFERASITNQLTIEENTELQKELQGVLVAYEEESIEYSPAVVNKKIRKELQVVLDDLEEIMQKSVSGALVGFNIAKLMEYTSRRITEEFNDSK